MKHLLYNFQYDKAQNQTEVERQNFVFLILVNEVVLMDPIIRSLHWYCQLLTKLSSICQEHYRLSTLMGLAMFVPKI